ncbi:MAG TPA: M4 family metallopeptidase [Kofleriaceae bacterium]|nr:M4 family metallopeptidase [Kofleriaceae bacterium]
MNRRHIFVLVAFAGCSQESGGRPAIVTEPIWHLEVSNRQVEGEIGPAAVAYLSEQELGLSPEEELAVVSITRGPDRLAHVRVQELHRGVPVLGAVIAVHADETTFVAYGGNVTRNLEGFEVEPALDGERALAIAREAVAAMIAAPAPIEARREARELAIQPRDGGGAFLVWQVEMLADSQPGVEPGRWFVQVDAGSGEVIEIYNGLATGEQASGPGGNPKAPRTWSAELDVEEDGGEFAMDTARLTTLDLANAKEGGEVVTGPIDPIGDPAINDAHGFAEVTLDMMREWMGYDSIDGEGFPIVSRVHYDDDLANAFWNGEVMTYGDGGDKFHPLSGALDVVAHEINHGFTQFHSNLNYKKMSGGLNESFSDIAGAIAEFYLADGSEDFSLGEDAIKEGDALRFMCDPTQDGDSIDHADDYDDGWYIKDVRIFGTDVHHSSGIGNKAFCLAVARYVATGASQSDSVRWMGQAWYLANAGYWTADASFSQGCQGTVDAARALGFSSDALVAIEQSWADVGVYCDSGEGDLACEADGECDVDAGETCFSCAVDCGSCTESCSGWKKAKCKIGIGDCSKCSDNNGCGDGECDEDESDETCGVDCGCRAPDDSCGSVAPYGCWCDEACVESGDCCADVAVCQ